MTLLWLLACAPNALDDTQRAVLGTLGPAPTLPASPTNRVADDPVAAELGRSLFFDEGLSSDGQTSCASCHMPELNFTDGEVVATALGTGTRNTPSLLGGAHQPWFFWDGRADSLWAQAIGPMLNPLEMGGTAQSVQARIVSAHLDPYTAVFGAPTDPQTTMVNAAKALEAFQRTLPVPESRFDQHLLGAATLTEDEQRGLVVFFDAGCINCHNGPLLTDHGFHNLGVPQIARGGYDIGRALGAVKVLEDPLNCRGPFADAPPTEAEPSSVTGIPAQRCAELHYLDPNFPDWPLAFKTPSLRGVSQTAPYMHDGSIASLDGVILFYSELPGQPPVGHRELTLQPLHLSDGDRADLKAFLGAL